MSSTDSPLWSLSRALRIQSTVATSLGSSISDRSKVETLVPPANMSLPMDPRFALRSASALISSNLATQAASSSARTR